MTAPPLHSDRMPTDTQATAACDWDDTDGRRQPQPCEEPSICTVTEACEHEHVFEARACANHAVEVQMEGPGDCRQYAAGPRPHDCPAVTVITWDVPTAPPLVPKEEPPPEDPACPSEPSAPQ